MQPYYVRKFSMTFVLTLSISTATPLYNIGFFSVEIHLTCNVYFITDQRYIDWKIFYYVNILHNWFRQLVSLLQSYITLTQTSIFIFYELYIYSEYTLRKNRFQTKINAMYKSKRRIWTYLNLNISYYQAIFQDVQLVTNCVGVLSFIKLVTFFIVMQNDINYA